MKLKASKLIAVLCVVATILTMIVPMTLSTAAATEVTETISFATKNQRTSFSAQQQVWASGEVVFTNNKGSSTSNVGDYANPVRLYASSSVTITAPGTITEIKIVCNTEKSSYKTVVENAIKGAGYTFTASGATYTFCPNAESVTFSKLSAQTRFNSITVTYEVADAGACQHENQTNVTRTEPTCTADGELTYTCGDCGETVTEVLKSEGHKFVDNACTVCGTNEYLPTTIDEALKMADGTLVMLSDVMVVFVEIPYSSTYKNITVTVRDLETGAELYLYQVKIDCKAGDILTVKGAMGTYNGKRQLANGGTAVKTGANEEYQVEYTEATIPEALALKDDTIVLVKGIVSKINTAWNASNANMNVTITDESGKTLYLYKLATKVGLGDEIAVLGRLTTYNNARQINSGATAEILKVGAVTEIAQMSVNAGADLSLLAHITLAYGEKIADYAVKFVHANGAEVLVTEFVEKNGKYVFALNQIAPQAMSDLITVSLVKGETVVDTVEDYSVKAYAQAILNGNFDAALKTFVSDMLAYGAAAQKHTGYNLENLATDGVEGLACSTATPDASVNVNAGVQNGEKVEGLGFTAVGVKFDNANYIYAKFTAASLEGITVTINGEATQIVDLGNGVYAVYSEAILATAFGQAFTVVLNNGTYYQTVTYSVNSYAFAKANTELGETLYRYGASAMALLA